VDSTPRARSLYIARADRAAEGRICGAAGAVAALARCALGRSMLDRVRLKVQGQLDADKITWLWEQHQSGNYDRSYYLWNVIAFQAMA
jgi:hypothetical protein